jgi:uncharacterized membrane protein YdjX (TVP38/TMEM64 family)
MASVVTLWSRVDGDGAPRYMMKNKARVASVVLVLVALAMAYHYGVFARLKDPAQLRDMLVAQGSWGQLAFVVVYTVMQPFGVPGTVFVMAAPLVWPWPTAFALSMVGTMMASMVGFSFARFVARDALASRIPERLKRYDRALEERAFVTVFLLRLVFWMPQVLHIFLGISRVSFWTHFWGSLFGYVIPLLVVSYFGQRFFTWMTHLHISPWWLLTLVVFGVGWYLRRRRSLHRV